MKTPGAISTLPPGNAKESVRVPLVPGKNAGAFFLAQASALMGVACAAALAWLFTRLVEPVYTFPEWVPAVLVEPKDIQTAFWNVWQTSATVVEYRTPELLRLRFLREVMAWSCGAAALLIGSLTGAGSMLFKRPAPDGEQSSTECAERS